MHDNCLFDSESNFSPLLFFPSVQERAPSVQSRLAWLPRLASLCPKLPLQHPAALPQLLSSPVCTAFSDESIFIFPPWLPYYPFCAVIEGLHRHSLFYTSTSIPCCFCSLPTKLLNTSFQHFVSPCWCLSDVTDPLCSPSVNTLAGAIDLAAKSAGIIPGSPCREPTSTSVDEKMLISSSPVTEDEPDADLLQHNVPEVSGTCIFAFLVATRLCLSCEGHLLTCLLKR